ncbi:MAG: DUF2147 domain-containing protein [Leptospiraceae bacterium]|nr:DUF2147 domain-containing protein [Leptospiraceae bacterium]MCB1319416.1 DUF2147 domain-containing protein [Leptospiraceae bacterium]
MKKLSILVLALASLALLSPLQAAGPDDYLGTWTTQSGKSRVLLFKCQGDKLCGKIVWLSEPNYPAGDAEAGQPKHDRNNPDASKRDRPIQGMFLVWGFTWDGEKWEDGHIYNPEDGKTYSCYMELEAPNRLKVRGYVGFSALGKTVYWTR